MTTATASFEITSWEPARTDERPVGPAIGKVTVRKTFTGDLEGSSVAELLTVQKGDEGLAYTAVERVEGTLHQCAGTFVLVHGAADPTPPARGSIVPGSGTGELQGLHGEVRVEHDEQGARFTFDYELG